MASLLRKVENSCIDILHFITKENLTGDFTVWSDYILVSDGLNPATSI